MSSRPTIIATDLEGVLVPEIWIAVAERTGIADLRLTTRDVPDYDQLMQYRLRILRERQIPLAGIQEVIKTLDPLPGAVEYLQWLRARAQCIILSDTFYDFAAPLMEKLGYPTLFCNMLDVDHQGMISGYRLRQSDGKRHAVHGLQQMGFHVISIGDSYNDTTMLTQADTGILFRAPSNVIAEFPQFQVIYEYPALQDAITAVLDTPPPVTDGNEA